jgi:hypothetical protein
VIVAVEGPSGAGKTTWCQQHVSSFVEEYAVTGVEPDGSDLTAQARFWIAVNSRRWKAAQALEARSGTAVCDGDPLKLHYSWCLSRIGAAPWVRFEQELAHARQAFALGVLGFVDLVLISIPSPTALTGRHQADSTRRRRSFALHRQLAEPLTTWYQAVDALDPGRVIWQFPDEGVPQASRGPRDQRSDPALLDGLIALLPPRG